MKSLKLFLPCVALLFLSACQKSVPAPESLTSEPVHQKISGPSTQELNGLQNPEAAGQVDPDIEEFISFMENAVAFSEKFNNLDTLTGFDIRRMALDEEHYDVNYIEAHLSATSFSTATQLIQEYEALVADVEKIQADFVNQSVLELATKILGNGQEFVSPCDDDYTNCVMIASVKYALMLVICAPSGVFPPVAVACVGVAVITFAQSYTNCGSDLVKCREGN